MGKKTKRLGNGRGQKGRLKNMKSIKGVKIPQTEKA